MTLSGVAARTPDGRTLFHDLTLTIGRERLGVVGRNGSGKSTLARMIAGQSEPVEGAVTRACRIGWLDQAIGAASGTVAQALGVAEALETLSRLLDGRGDAYDAAAADWTLEMRIAQALADVGLAALDLSRELSTLSGGERTRVALAGLLLEAPDLLVLDEPTNHLDRAGRDAVGELLSKWPGGAVVVSHDRALLRAMDRILEVSELGVSLHGGGYDAWREARDAERERSAQALETARREAASTAREAQRAAERQARRDKAGRAFRARASEPKILLDFNAQRAERTQARGADLAARKEAEAQARLEAADARVERARDLAFELPSTGLAAGRVVVELDAAVISLGEGRELGPLSLRVSGPRKIALSGANGSGKTSLLRVLAGRRCVDAGSASVMVPCALIDQDAALLNDDETLLQAFLRLNPAAGVNAAQAALARFLFRNQAAQRVVGTLSGGERLRAALACVLGGPTPAQLLLLDEPTNHLDLTSIEAVEAALAVYDGALVVVSHDQAFLDALSPDVWLDLDQPQADTSPLRFGAEAAGAATTGSAAGRP